MAIFAVFALFISACSTDGGTAEETSTTAASEVSSTTTSPSSTTTTAAPAEPITIAVELPLSGFSAEAANTLRRGFELTAEEVNADGGINGAMIELDIQDDEGDPTIGVALIDRFISDGAVAIVGTYNSPVILAQAEAVAAAGIPQLVYGVSQAIADLNNEWVFQLGPTDSGQVHALVDRMREQGLSKPALLTDEGGLGAFARPTLESVIAEEGIELVLNDTFAADATDLSNVMLKAKNAGADSVIVWTTGPAYATIMDGAQQVGLDVPVFGNGSAADPTVARIGGSAIDQLVFLDAIDRTKPSVVALTEKWAGEFEGVFPSEAFAAHDMLMIVVTALREVGPDPSAIRDFMDSYSTSDLLSGREGSSIMFAPGDHVALEGDNTVWKTYRDGVIVLADG